MNYQHLQKTDQDAYSLLKEEEKRQCEGLVMIASENYVSPAVLEAQGTIFTNKYSEGYPGKRYYSGNSVVDRLEVLCQDRALSLFDAKDYKVNVQAYSGSPANLAVLTGLLEFGDTVLSLDLHSGGHLTHGSPVNFSGKAFKFVHYPLYPDSHLINYDALEELAELHKPKIILSGFTAYPREVDFKRVSEIARAVKAFSFADISHIAGLIAAGVHQSPFPHTDIITTTTHKTLRGPRAAMIFSKPELAEKIDKAVFPGLQGGPHNNTLLALAVALKEAEEDSFKIYAHQVVKNSQVLANTLKAARISLISDGSDNHLVLVDLRPFGVGKGEYVALALEAVGIYVNKNTVPGESSTPLYPSGIRIGTAALTTRGMKEGEMIIIGEMIAKIIHAFASTDLPAGKDVRQKAIADFIDQLQRQSIISEVRAKVMELTGTFTAPGIN